MRVNSKKQKLVTSRIYNTRACAKYIRQKEIDEKSNKVEAKNNVELVKMSKREENISDEKSELNELIRLFMLKMQKEEDEKNKTNVSIEYFSKVVPDFDGVTISVEKWFENFDKNAEAYELNDKQKYVHARNKMNGAAKLFLEAVSVCDYAALKKILTQEFRKTYSSAEIHKQLSNRKKFESETFHEYILHMRKIAAAGDVEDISVIRYIVDGLQIKPELKYALYNSKSFSDLREQFSLYERTIKWTYI